MYNIVINLFHKDKRVKFVEKIATKRGYTVSSEPVLDKKNIYIIMPREKAENILEGSKVFDFPTLSKNSQFVLENNRLTAFALLKVFKENNVDFIGKSVLLMGYGKLTEQLQPVLEGAQLSILNFNPEKQPEIEKKYSNRAYFYKAPLKEFDIIINTIPKQVISLDESRGTKKDALIYELASPPFGFDFQGADASKFNYRIEPGLPGRYFPNLAAKAIFDVVEEYIEQEEIKNQEKKESTEEEKVSKKDKSIVFALTGCSCVYDKIIDVIKQFTAEFNVLPIISQNADITTRFVKIEEFKKQIEDITGNKFFTTISQAERYSADKSIEAVVICPCTGNTMAKIVHAITDTPVVMAAKAVTRNNKPCVIAFTTNDGLSNSLPNVAALLNRKNYFVVPFNQDDYGNKPNSVASKWGLVYDATIAAINGKQLQPVFYEK